MATPTRVNAPNPDIDGNPDVTDLADGRAAIAYQSRRADGEFDIVMRIREADGTLSDEIHPEGAWTRAGKPEVTTLSDGSALLSWLATDEGTTPPSKIFAQRFDDAGTALSPAFLLADIAELRLRDRTFDEYRVEADPDGGFSVYWSWNFVNSEGQVYPRQSAIQYATDDALFAYGSLGYYTTRLDGNASITKGDDSILWSEGGQVASFGDAIYLDPDTRSDIRITGIPPIYGELNSRDMRAWATEFVPYGDDSVLFVVNKPYNHFLDFDMTDPDKSSVASDFSPFHAYIMTRSEVDGQVEITASDPIFFPEDRSYIDPVESYDVITLQGGGFAAAWSRDADIFAQVFDADGTPVGDNFVVAGGEAPQRNASLAQVDDGNLLFIWSEKRDGDKNIYSREVTLSEMSQGDYAAAPRPFIEFTGRLEGEALEGTVLRVTGSVESSYSIVETTLQWERLLPEDGTGRSEWEAITGATGLRYTLGAADVGASVRFIATARDTTGLEQSAELILTGPGGRLLGTVKDTPDPAEGTILVNGTPVVGETLTARPEITDADGIPEGAFLYQWLRDGEEIAGAFRPTYRLTDDDIGARIEAEIRFLDANGAQERVVSDEVFVRAEPTNGVDTLVGGAAADLISGLGGDDRIDGGLGADTLRGDSGADVFVFARDYGVDDIRDFTPGTDRVEFDFEDIGGIKALLRTADVSQRGDHVRIDFGNDDVLILRDVDKGDLTPADALFL
ncbi:hypothetical protein [Jannaschia formosa]|uniref:hypothetical protein n=1 Tax=Jannaschia formosa TaxID=2259592 RepID=UPI000E1B8D99|nr:hypothetical protein [Jannaschia formosa]TFL19294.1 hypothetical protein DR046_05050 [Jannaschia formosa]